MRENKYFEAFGKPFSAEDVSWKLQLTNKEKTSGLAVAYLDARAIADRLDAVVGQNRWKDEYKPWHNYVTKKGQKFAQLCTIYIYDEDLQEWIGKTDGAEDSDIEPIKGGLSDAFKRAAVRWNIGRYLYKMEPVWVDIEPRGDSFVIKKNEFKKLNEVYTKAVAAMFGNPSAASGSQMPKPQEKKPAEPKPQSQRKAENGAQTPVYEIQDVQVQTDASGDKSALALSDGKQRYRMYMYGKDDRLKKGARIKNVRAESKQNSYGPYYILNSYDMAA